MNQVNLRRSANPSLGYTDQQTNAEANYQQAMAHASADPRFNAKAYDRASVSRGPGQYAYGASKAATNYAANMAGSEATRMNDAYSNAAMRLNDQARQQDFGFALAGLQEQQNQNIAMNNLRRQGRAMDFYGNIFNQMMGMGGALGGLL